MTELPITAAPTNQTLSPLFKLCGENLGYGQQQILNQLDLCIYPGETVALVGASGSGKSTLLSHLYQHQRQHSALCPQHPGLVEPLSVLHNIYMGQLNHHGVFYNLLNLVRPMNKHRKAISQLAGQLGLSQQLLSSVDKLSGGQQQRTAIGRALYQQQHIFLGDEPLSSLDQIQGLELLKLIKSRHQTVVIALHDRQLALQAFDRIIGLKGGTIALDAPAKGVTMDTLDALYG